MRVVVDAPSRIIRWRRASFSHELPHGRPGQLYITPLPARAPDGDPLVWTVRSIRPDAGHASADVVLLGGSPVLSISRTAAVTRTSIEVVGVSERYSGLIRATVQHDVSGQPGAWLVPDLIAPTGGELCLWPRVLTVRPGATAAAWARSLSPISGTVYCAADVHAHVPSAAGSTWVAIGVTDAASLPTRPIPGDGQSVGVRRTGGQILVMVGGVLVDGHISAGLHRRIDLRISTATREVWVRTTTPYTWSGPHVVPGSGALYVVGYIDPGVVGSISLLTSPAELLWHDAYPTGATPGWTDP